MPAYKNDAGRWYCAFYYKDWTGKRRKKKKESFATRREALKWEREFLEKYAGSPELSFSVLAKAYLENAKLKNRPQTYLQKRDIINQKILPFFGEMKVSEIDRAAVSQWRDSLLAKGYKTTYLHLIHSVLTNIFSYAVEFYGLTSNPSKNVQGFTSQAKKNVDFWTLEEFQKFAITLKKPVHIIAFYLLFWTGMRVGEMLALTWNDIDLDEGTISITKTLYQVGKKVFVNETKTTSGDRTIVIPNFLVEMLRDYKRLSEYTTEEHIIPVTHNDLFMKLKAGAKKAGVKRIRIHDLRHSHASMLIKAHCTPVEVADRLGHKDPSLTLKVYSHMYAAQRRKIADMLNTIYT